MRFWPASLQSRLMALLFLALLLANTLTLSLLFYERMSSARSVMLDNGLRCRDQRGDPRPSAGR